MASKNTATPSNAEVAAAFRVIALWAESQGGISTSAPAASDEEKLNEEEVRALPIGELRTLAAELGLDEQKVKSKILDEMASKNMFEEDEDGDEDDVEDEEEDEDDDDTSEDDEDGDEDDEEEELTREDLEGMSLKELRDLAKEEGHARGDYIKADKDALVELLLGDDEDEEDGEEDEQELSEDDIRAMSLAEIKKLAAELGVKISPAIAKNRKKIADKILDEMAEEE